MKRIENLAKAAPSHQIQKIQKPKLATECANLSFKPVDDLQLAAGDSNSSSSGGGNGSSNLGGGGGGEIMNENEISSGVFPLETDRVRMVIRVRILGLTSLLIISCLTLTLALPHSNHISSSSIFYASSLSSPYPPSHTYTYTYTYTYINIGTGER